MFYQDQIHNYREPATLEIPKQTLLERLKDFYYTHDNAIWKIFWTIVALSFVTSSSFLVKNCESSSEKDETAAFVGVQTRAERWVSENHLSIVPTTIHCIRHEPGQGRGELEHICTGMTPDSRIVHMICSRTACRAE